MKWVCILHFYQPPYQKSQILNQIVNECYLPLTQMLIKQKSSYSLYCNINQSLIEQLLLNKHFQVLENMAKLVGLKRIRLTLTPSYHPILPLIPKHVAIEQIRANQQILKQQFCYSDYDLFFPPELAYNPNSKISKISTLLSQGALQNQIYSPFVIYNNKKFVIRHTNLSNMIMGGEIRDFRKLNLEHFIGNNNYFVTAVDAETFGHHKKGYIDVLDNLLKHTKTSFIPKNSSCYKKVSKLYASSWSSFNTDYPYVLWKDKTNKIHKLLWKLSNLVAIHSKTPSQKQNYYKGLSSCTFWWASAKPWWSIEMIERGAWQMYLSVSKIKSVNRQAYRLYSEIILLAFKWQRQGKIDKNFNNQLTKTIPFSLRCKKGELQQVLKKLQKAEKLAVKTKNYELAIKWRDAQTKLKNNTDIFDVWHVVDQLRGFKEV